MEKIKIVFIGGLSNGKIVYEYLNKNKHVDLPLIITYGDNNNKPRSVNFPNKNNIVKCSTANKYLKKIKETKPDFIFVAGWSELLNDELIQIPSKGTIGFHPAKLPKDRGRSVLAWQIEEGYDETALTMFYYSNIPDGGDIIAQENIKIETNDYINDVLKKIDKATYNIMRAYFPLLRKGKAPRTPQDQSRATVRRLRTDRDSLIDWNQNAVNIYNKIRAISKPYPGAYTFINKKKVRIWYAEKLSYIPNILSQYINFYPGTIICCFSNDKYLVKTKDSFLFIWCEEKLIPGDRI